MVWPRWHVANGGSCGLVAVPVVVVVVSHIDLHSLYEWGTSRWVVHHGPYSDRRCCLWQLLSLIPYSLVIALLCWFVFCSTSQRRRCWRQGINTGTITISPVIDSWWIFTMDWKIHGCRATWGRSILRGIPMMWWLKALMDDMVMYSEYSTTGSI